VCLIKQPSSSSSSSPRAEQEQLQGLASEDGKEEAQVASRAHGASVSSSCSASLPVCWGCSEDLREEVLRSARSSCKPFPFSEHPFVTGEQEQAARVQRQPHTLQSPQRVRRASHPITRLRAAGEQRSSCIPSVLPQSHEERRDVTLRGDPGVSSVLWHRGYAPLSLAVMWNSFESNASSVVFHDVSACTGSVRCLQQEKEKKKNPPPPPPQK